jgi:dihydrofolate reductase
VIEAVRKLKEEDGGPIQVHGSRTLAQSLLKAGLVDEFRVLIFPVILGSGARLYPESDEKMKLELADSQVFESGVVANTYRPATT